MERENRKRGREEEEAEPGKEGDSDLLRKREKKKQDAFLADDADIFDLSDTYRPLAVFEFPWGQGVVLPESYGWDFRDVFFSSLVDGCSAKIGFPGDRLCRTPAAISLPGESSGEEEIEIDGFDCIWSSVLRQPLSAGFSKVPNA